ncbi:hypothetical protein DMB44_03015 [Thermoplasma sp. Kam2015]|uniref:hypothetical protein n=1 Tax=Thermoplasma sp. Kam2015 TaxID=2094122 RepID=UPI000D9EE4D4|nr:hypothetical protein [Thermoplasma sp. Kam2015]PYB68592.1 hypothetical protein DMB44_03015 [Thermoplasma sp. Kam2015]
MIAVDTLIYDVIRSIVALYLTLLTPLWHLIVYYGLNPENSYGVILKPGPTYYSMYSFILNTAYSIILPASIVLFSIIIALRAFLMNFRLTHILMNLLIPFLSLALSFKILMYMALASEYIFDYLWSYGNVNWYSLFSITQILNFSTNDSSSSMALVFLYLTSYFLAMSSLLAELIFREAAELLLIAVIPIFSSIAFIRRTQEYLVRIFSSFIELNLLPIPVIIDLHLAFIFSADPILQLGFFMLAPVLPSLIFLEIRTGYFRMKPLNIPSSAVLGFIGGQLEESAAFSMSKKLDWSNVYSKEASYRREESD